MGQTLRQLPGTSGKGSDPVKTWKVVITTLILLVVIYGVYVTFLNYDSLREPFYLSRTSTTTIGVFILLAFLAGFVTMGLRFLLESWRRDRESRKSKATLQREMSVHDKIALLVWSILVRRTEPPSANVILAGSQDHPLLSFLTRCVGAVPDDQDQSIESLQELTAKYPEFTGVKLVLASELISRNQLDEAQKLIDSLPVIPGLETSIMTLRRNLAVARRDWKDSIAIEKKIMARTADKGDHRRMLVGLQYEQARDLIAGNNLRPALTILRVLQKDHPHFIPAWVMTGDLYIKEDEAEKAVSIWREGFLKTHAIILLHRITDLFLDREQPEKAIETLADIVYSSENDTIPRFFLGRLYYRLEMHDEALREFNLIKPRVFRSPTLNYLIGVLEERTGKPEKATAAFRRVISEIGALKTEYFCTECKLRTATWSDRCPRCGSWNSIEVDYPEEKTQPTDLGLNPYPIRFTGA